MRPNTNTFRKKERSPKNRQNLASSSSRLKDNKLSDAGIHDVLLILLIYLLCQLPAHVLLIKGWLKIGSNTWKRQKKQPPPTNCATVLAQLRNWLIYRWLALAMLLSPFLFSRPPHLTNIYCNYTDAISTALSQHLVGLLTVGWIWGIFWNSFRDSDMMQKLIADFHSGLYSLGDPINLVIFYFGYDKLQWLVQKIWRNIPETNSKPSSGH